MNTLNDIEGQVIEYFKKDKITVKGVSKIIGEVTRQLNEYFNQKDEVVDTSKVCIDENQLNESIKNITFKFDNFLFEKFGVSIYDPNEVLDNLISESKRINRNKIRLLIIAIISLFIFILLPLTGSPLLVSGASAISIFYVASKVTSDRLFGGCNDPIHRSFLNLINTGHNNLLYFMFNDNKAMAELIKQYQAFSELKAKIAEYNPGETGGIDSRASTSSKGRPQVIAPSPQPSSDCTRGMRR